MAKAVNPKTQKGIWGWTWRITLVLVSIAVILAGALITLGFYIEHKTKMFAARTQTERNLIVYDAFTKIIEADYFDPSFGGVDWKAATMAARPEAAAAKNPVALYNDVLFPMAARIPSSHVAVVFTKDADSGGAHVKGDLQKKLPPVNGEFDYGFDWVPLQRARSKFVVVGDVRRGSEAEAAGVAPGWLLNEGKITPVYDEKRGWRIHFKGSFFPIVADHARYSSANGTSTLKFQFENAPSVQLRQFDFYGTVAPPTPPFEMRRLSSGVLYVRFDTFGNDDFNTKVMDQVVAAISQADSNGIIIDLRRNSGGAVSQTKRFLSHFLPPMTILGKQWSRKGEQTWRTNFWSKRYAGPVLLLVGPMTASGGEVVAANMKYYKRATVVGRITNGSLLVSQQRRLPDGGTVQVATQDYIGPDGRHIEAIGVAPDIEVIPQLVDIRAGHDPVLERAVQTLLNASGTKTGH